MNKPDDNQIRVKEFRLNKNRLTLNANDEFQMLPVFTPSNPDEFTVLWSSSDSDTVKIDSLGRVTAVKPGKATIYGECIDGGFISSCEIEITEAKTVNTSVIFDNAFSNRENWTGDIERIGDNNIIMWFIRKDYKINTVQKFTPSNNFMLQVKYEITDNKGIYFGNYTSFKFNNLEMRIIDGASSFEVRYNGEILATHNSYFEIEPRTYTLKYYNGRIEMYKGGELIISVDKQIVLSSSHIELYSSEGERFCMINDLKLVEII